MESTGWNNAFGYIRHWQTADVYVRILNDTVGISKAKSSWNNPLPANCVIIGDSRAQSGVQWYALDNNSWGLLSGLGLPHERHGDHVVTAFADTHVERVTGEQLIDNYFFTAYFKSDGTGVGLGF